MPDLIPVPILEPRVVDFHRSKKNLSKDNLALALPKASKSCDYEKVIPPGTTITILTGVQERYIEFTNDTPMPLRDILSLAWMLKADYTNSIFSKNAHAYFSPVRGKKFTYRYIRDRVIIPTERNYY